MRKGNMYDWEAWNHAEIDGANAAQEIKTGHAVLHQIRIWAVGGAGSKIEVFDGTVDDGIQIDLIEGTATGTWTYRGLCEDGLYTKVTDTAGTIKGTVWYK
jgi:hypothetical protein